MAENAKKSKPTVKWDARNTFEERTMRPRDWKTLGAEDGGTADVVWSEGNGWTVARSLIPLDDAQLAAFMARDPKFSLNEG